MVGSRAEKWEQHTAERSWKYQTPEEILVKASNGASDFGNKFGQPLVTGSLLTFEGEVDGAVTGFDHTVMLAGGVGYTHADHALKGKAAVGDKIVLLGGDNYRIGMAGGSVSSVDTGKYAKELELTAVQRANPEMQKRAYNAIRALAERAKNPIKLIHDHGAGGHINCLSELLEEQGGQIEMIELPVGDPTLSAKEIICNESQERMGLIVAAEDIALLERIAARERAPFYVVGEVTGDNQFTFIEPDGTKPVDIPLEILFGSSPKTVLEDSTVAPALKPVAYDITSGEALLEAVKDVLSLEGVACKDWLTNKVDRSVTGLVALQQCAGPLQLPLNNVGVAALDYSSKQGIATAIGHAPVVGLIDPVAGSKLSVAEALTNIVWAPINEGLEGVALSANWMWPAKQPGENARLYTAVEALSEFCIELGIAVPTGKDSLSMTMKYGDGASVKAPGTVVVSAAGHCDAIDSCVSPVLLNHAQSIVLYVDLSSAEEFHLGGSSFAQTLGVVGDVAPTVACSGAFKNGFNEIQALIREGKVFAGHDVSSGGLITAIAEMAFGGNCGVTLSTGELETEVIPALFCEKPAVLLQVAAADGIAIIERFANHGLRAVVVGRPGGMDVSVDAGALSFSVPVADLRNVWFAPSALLDAKQTAPGKASERAASYAATPLEFHFPETFTGRAAEYGASLVRTGTGSGARAAIIREKGTNGDREMAFCLHAAGFEVLDVTMWDLMTGAATLEDVNMVVFPGGFSNSDVLGAARGWAGAFRYNETAKAALEKFYQRPDTLSLGVCNGCQLANELDLITGTDAEQIRLHHNASEKFESSFLAVDIVDSPSVMLKPLVGSRLGIWVAHGEGRFVFPKTNTHYALSMQYVASSYPANPNGSPQNAAAVVSKDGRHLAMMPHLERALLPWQWAYYTGRKDDEVSPWLLSFVAARDWIRNRSR